MRIQMLTTYAGVNFALNSGEQYDVDDDDAKLYIAAGGAIEITTAKPAKKPAKKKAASAKPTRKSDT